MPKRRELVTMSEEEMWTFIESQKSIQVATIGRDGSPHLVPLWFAIDDGEIILETFSKSQKIKNLERDDRISVLLEDGGSYPELKGVSIRGRAELIRDHDRVHEMHLDIIMRNQPGIERDALAEATRAMVPKKTIIKIKAEQVMSWDHSKLDGIY
jgi:PPOX class probable F420-dependent enzyme